MEPNQTQHLQEIQAQIETIYNETMQKLNEIETHKKEIIQSYIKELEQQKINLLRKHLDEHNK
jgi:hypothetical protein